MIVRYFLIAKRTGRNWLLRKLAASLRLYTSKSWVEKAWKNWYSRAIRSRLDFMKYAARSIKNHLWEILKAEINGVDNAQAVSIYS